MRGKRWHYPALAAIMLLAGLKNLFDWHRDGEWPHLPMGALLVALSPIVVFAWLRDRKHVGL